MTPSATAPLACSPPWTWQRGRPSDRSSSATGRKNSSVSWSRSTKRCRAISEVHLVHNDATHRTPEIRRWLLRHPRFHLHFTPTSGSWLNMVERWFADLTTKKIKRGAHMSVKALEKDIRDWIALWNEDPVPTSGSRL